MKTAFLLFVLAGSFTATIAQPVVRGYEFNPVIGETIETNSLPDSINVGSTGTNRTWDFSSIGGNNTNQNVYISPNGTPQASSFSANLCSHNTPGSPYVYFYGDNSRLTNLGNCSSTGSGVVKTSNPRSIYRYPIVYNSYYSEIIAETITDVTTGYSSYINGTKNWKVVGYGTLILPSGTYNNVLKVVSVTKDTTRDSQQQVVMVGALTETYWMYPGVHGPLLYNVVGETSVTGNPTPIIIHSGSYITAGPLAVNEMVAKKYQVACFPNPAQNVINLSFELKAAGDAGIQVITANGAVVARQEAYYAQPGKVTVPINIDQLASGLYFIDLNISGVHISEQFLKK